MLLVTYIFLLFVVGFFAKSLFLLMVLFGMIWMIYKRNRLIFHIFRIDFVLSFWAGLISLLFIFGLWQVMGYGIFAGLRFDVDMLAVVLVNIVLLSLLFARRDWMKNILGWSAVLALTFVWWVNIGWMEYIFFWFLYCLTLLLAVKNKYWGIGFLSGFLFAYAFVDFRLLLSDYLVAMVPGAYLLGILVLGGEILWWIKKK